AQDDAFAFCYPHLLADWKEAGAELSFFSPLNNEAPNDAADFIYLPGGYPELFAGQLSTADTFMNGLRSAASKGTYIFGECGGYMTLGRSLTDGSGATFSMADLLPVETSFEQPKLHLGYRNATLAENSFLGSKGTTFKAHEFHYASVTQIGEDTPLFSLTNAKEESLSPAGLLRSNVAGSFIHLIDRANND
ncbi:MAG: hypothetical protein JKX94_05120, partial [Sneathiella sp.]|nr:hypothetical protein [Sneathiella sp.]